MTDPWSRPPRAVPWARPLAQPSEQGPDALLADEAATEGSTSDSAAGSTADPAAGSTTEPFSTAAAPGRRRLVGVDAARGLALVGMIAIHILPSWDPETFEPTAQWTVFAGRSAALFALLAGVGLAFSTGGRTPHTGRSMTADRVGVAVRALLIAGLGLAINHVLPGSTIDEVPAVNILVYYGAFFLLAIPFLRLSAGALFGWAAFFALAGPVLVHVLRDVLPVVERYNPDFLDLVADPGATAARLLLTGTFPALPYLAYLLTGLAIGRLDLARIRVQTGLVLGGVLLAVGASLTSWALLVPAGGFGRLVARTPGLDEELVTDNIVWGPEPTLPTTTWWWLAIGGPYTNTPPALLLGLGSAVAALGVFLLLARRFSTWLLPLSAMGSMTLSVYSAHLLALAAEVHYGRPLWFVIHVAVAMAFALLWRRAVGQGPLERLVAVLVRGTRRRVLARERRTDRGAAG
ncbi:heparan-alpha-glucosaminide N-acetyltransferase domain-containing protein [Kocuria rhizosphaericola]|uniref:heparan-alpha-glucosaminide N-acetyltransferase domain-containing protein n=1 Tax=Kocuria rhizosphaericola TaxID=3376284 RepID=UPI0037A71781